MVQNPGAEARKPQTLKGRLLRIALPVLPGPILFRLIHYATRRTPGLPSEPRKDERIFAPQEGVELLVFWSDTPNVGSGPSAVLYVLGEEVMKLDCFGGDVGHMHFNSGQQRYVGLVAARVLFPPGSHADHVERAAFELVANTDAALKSNRLPRIRSCRIDETALAQAAESMRGYMTELLGKYPSSTS